MVRLFVLILLLLNSLYLAWTQGLLAGIGLAPAQQTEPQRRQQQINPDALRLIVPQDLAQSETARPGASPLTQCLQAGPFNLGQSALLQSVLAAALPPDSWTLEAATGQGMMLRLPRADEALRARLNDLGTALGNQPLHPCQQTP